MTKTFCDRCGAEIEKYNYAWLSSKLVYIKAKLLISREREDWKEDEKYLCPKCENSYIHWFMNPDKDENDK